MSSIWATSRYIFLIQKHHGHDGYKNGDDLELLQTYTEDFLT